MIATFAILEQYTHRIVILFPGAYGTADWQVPEVPRDGSWRIGVGRSTAKVEIIVADMVSMVRQSKQMHTYEGSPDLGSDREQMHVYGQPTRSTYRCDKISSTVTLFV